MQPYLPRPVINYLMCDITNKYIYYTETFSRGGEGGGWGDGGGLHPHWSWFEVNGTEVYDWEFLNDFYRNCLFCRDLVRVSSDMCCDWTHWMWCACANAIIQIFALIVPKRMNSYIKLKKYYHISVCQPRKKQFLKKNLVCALKYVCFLRSQEARMRVSRVFFLSIYYVRLLLDN